MKQNENKGYPLWGIFLGSFLLSRLFFGIVIWIVTGLIPGIIGYL